MFLSLRFSSLLALLTLLLATAYAQDTSQTPAGASHHNPLALSTVSSFPGGAGASSVGGFSIGSSAALPSTTPISSMALTDAGPKSTKTDGASAGSAASSSQPAAATDNAGAKEARLGGGKAVALIGALAAAVVWGI